MSHPQATALERDGELVEELVHELLAEHADRGLREHAERVHALAVAGRGGAAGAADRLRDELALVPSDQAPALVRACALQLQLANVCEELERVRRRRAYDADSGSPQPWSIADAATRLASLPRDRVLEALAGMHCRLVITMHPSDATRRAVLYKQRGVAEALEELARTDIGAARRHELHDELAESLETWWRTDEVRRVRPDVHEEVRRTLFYFESVLFDAAPAAVIELERRFGTQLVRSPLVFGTWAGGDMDGHPDISAPTVLATLAELRRAAVDLLRARVRRLTRLYTHGESRIDTPPELTASIARDLDELPGIGSLRDRLRHEPLRLKLYLVWHRLEATAAGQAAGYASPAALIEDLDLVGRAAGPAGRRSLSRLVWQARIFGFHLARLDVREHATRLQAATEAMLPGYGGDEEARARRLAEAIAAGERGGPAGPVGDLARVPATFAAAAEGIARYGEEAIARFVVSGAEAPSDVLAAVWQARRAGARGLDVAPLLESSSSLAGAERTVRRLFADPAYGAHLADRGRRQDVMVGYSDASKENGYLAGHHLIHRASGRLATAAAEAGVRLTLFHGRGGSPARGGGHVHEAILGSPAATQRAGFEMTEQGETVRTKYGHPELALRALEQTLSALVEHAVAPAPDPPEPFAAELARAAAAGRAAYRALLDDPAFPAFFTDTTPIDVLPAMNIGSRPTSRAGGEAIDGLRAIPWVFAWTQTRLLLPAWYGVGAGLRDGDRGLQRDMVARWPFFRSLIGTLEAALFRVDLDTARRYLVLARDREAAGRLWAAIEQEHRATVAATLEITGQDALLEGRPAVRARLRFRNPWVDPLNALQIELLRRHRAGDAAALDPLLGTVAGIAAGLYTTG